MGKIPIKDLSREELKGALETAGCEPYRALQVFRWLYRSAARSFDEMTDMPVPLRRRLSETFYISFPEIADSKRSHSDGTTKYLLRLQDGNTVEAVLLPEGRRNTICLSSQVGCKFGCVFCASASAGFVRSLSQAEMVDEVLAIKSLNPGAAVTNIVFMGIGEPFDNYDNVMRAARIFNDKDALNIGARKMTISTCGVVPGMERLAKEGLQIELSVSLHSADDAVRSKLLPVNRRYGLAELIPACKKYIKATNRVITFEYVLLDGVNSSAEDAGKLVKLLGGIKCKVNAISYNRIPGGAYREPSSGDVKTFMKILKDGGVNATHRRPKGEDIDAGCGQLRISRLKK